MYKEFIKEAEQNYSHQSCLAIEAALEVAVALLEPFTRWDGSPFILHSIGVARIVMSEVGLGRNTTIAALLHDASRMKLISDSDIAGQWGEATLGVLRGMNNISELEPKLSTMQAENYKELILSYSADPRVILLKMADRLEVMRSLEGAALGKRYKKSWETLNLYAPIAHKLGLYNIKSEMEDLSLKYLEPKQFADIERLLAESADERAAFIASFTAPIISRLDSLDIKYTLKSRTKSIYSIWKKMQKQHVPFEEVFDIFAIRIIIDCEREVEKMQCWTVFSVVTDFYTPNPKRMRDWISIPKSNGYESLHATVVTPSGTLPAKLTGGKWVEVQIRSQRMDEMAERGLAAHWRYKGVAASDSAGEIWLSRLRNILETKALNEPIKEEFNIADSSDEVFIFTPAGDLRKLPVGATVLDFAFDIHSNVGATCTAARVNGRVVPIREVLKSGNIVEIITSKSQKPKADWLTIAVTGKARNRIRQILRQQNAASSDLGREELERKLKNWKLTLSVDEAVAILTKAFKVRTGVEVYSLIFNQSYSMAQVKEFLVAASSQFSGATSSLPSVGASGSSGASSFSGSSVPSGVSSSSEQIVFEDQNLRGLAYKFAKCCNPIFGDDVFGFVTINTGVTIHRRDCPNAPRLHEQFPYRIIGLRWRDNSIDGVFIATLKLRGQDMSGLSATITDTLSRQLKVNIRSLAFNTNGQSVEGIIVLEIKGSQMLDAVIYALKRIRGINSVTRVSQNNAHTSNTQL